MSYNKIRKSRKVLYNAMPVICKKTWIRPQRLIPKIDFVSIDELDLGNYGILQELPKA